MTLKTFLTLAVFAAATALSGCAITDPWHEDSRLNQSWGRAYQAQIGEQIEDPDAPHSDKSPEGLDSQTSERVAERYYRGQDSQRTRRAEAVVIGEF